jgi:hypothetical protein
LTPRELKKRERKDTQEKPEKRRIIKTYQCSCGNQKT